MTMIETGSDFIPEASLDGDVVYCRLDGDLTVNTVPWAKVVVGKLIKDHKPSVLRIDLKAAEFVDSAGLASLVMAKKTMDRGGRVVLLNTGAPVRGLMKIAQLDQLFEFEEAADA